MMARGTVMPFKLLTPIVAPKLQRQHLEYLTTLERKILRKGI